jgi:D-serine deaminase-like pyridoxal phosphate-dependent protein
LRYLGTESAGEVQTPLRGRAARTLTIGDRVWFRHAKSGEVCEHLTELLVVDGGRIVDRFDTYRGEGKAF